MPFILKAKGSKKKPFLADESDPKAEEKAEEETAESLAEALGIKDLAKFRRLIEACRKPEGPKKKTEDEEESESEEETED
jgi:hypothetical protein